MGLHVERRAVVEQAEEWTSSSSSSTALVSGTSAWGEEAQNQRYRNARNSLCDATVGLVRHERV